MSTTRKEFDRNFKLKAVELSYQRSNIRSLTDELGIRVALLYRWRREFASHSGASFAGNGKVVQSQEQSELARLKRELEEVRQERDILKKLWASSPGAMENLPVHSRTPRAISHREDV